MVFVLHDLNAETRSHMIDEIRTDAGHGRLYYSPRLSTSGEQDYLPLLSEAAQFQGIGWLAERLCENGRLKKEETRVTKGGPISAKVPSNAHEMLAEGEFNRFYLRALCRRIAAESGYELIIYRAKSVAAPRPESEAKIGQTIDAAKLLEDLRAHIGVDTALGLPPGPNSGLSARLSIIVTQSTQVA